MSIASTVFIGISIYIYNAAQKWLEPPAVFPLSRMSNGDPMRPDPSRVAYRHLRASSTSTLVKTVQDALAMATSNADNLIEQAQLLERLISAGEARRLGRTSAIRVQSTSFDGNRIVAKIQGTSGDYDTRISLKPRPGHHCTCPDWARNGKRVGPCKHVLRLGEYWRDEKVVPGLEEVADSLVGTLF